MITAVGLMSGTSADGVDAAWIETDGHIVTRTGASLTVPYPDALRRALLAVMQDPARAEADRQQRLSSPCGVIPSGSDWNRMVGSTRVWTGGASADARPLQTAGSG